MAIASQIIAWTALYGCTLSLCICVICLCTVNQILKTLPKLAARGTLPIDELSEENKIFPVTYFHTSLDQKEDQPEVGATDIASIAEQKLKENLKRLHQIAHHS